MRPRTSRRAAAAAAVGALLAGGCSSGAADAPPPNLVLIVVDTLRADHVHDPDGRVDTPGFDALAADGVEFRHALAHAPMTLPSHTALFSSRRPDQNGIVLNSQQVPEDLPLLAEHLAAQGYRTRATVSIWTLGARDRTWGIERGFERYDRDYIGLLPAAPRTQERLGRQLDELAGSDRPFFLFAHYSDPHLPYNVHDGSVERSAEYRWNGEVIETLPLSDMTAIERTLELRPGDHVFELRSETPFRCKVELDYDAASLVPLDAKEGDAVPGGRGANTWKRLVSRLRNTTDGPVTFGVRLWIAEEPGHDERPARYAGEVEFVDRWVGRLVDELKQRGLYDRSLVVFTSDHGEAFGEHGRWGHKENLYDELLHVPLVVKPPAGHPSRAALERASAGLVTHVDVAPTLLEILGLPPLPGQRGRSLLDGGAPRELVAATRLELREVEVDGEVRVGEDLVVLRDEAFKLVYHRLEDRFEMYDLAADPGEREDVFAARGAERAAWPARLREAAARLAEVDYEARREALEPGDLQDLSTMGYTGDGGEGSDE